MPGATLEDTEINVTKLSTVTSVEQALEQCLKQSQEIERQLDEQLSQSSKLSSTRAVALSSSSQLAAAISDDAEELTSLLASAARTSTAACARIRDLHAQLERGNAALSWAEDILSLRVCAEGAKTSLSADDLPAAAEHVARYLALGDAVRADPASASAVSQMEQSRAELTRKVTARADKALQDDANALSAQASIDAIRLFVPIGSPQDGLSRLAKYLARKIKMDSHEDVRELLLDVSGEPSTGVDEPHIVALARLFEGVAACVHDCQPQLIKLFGKDAMIFLIGELQTECDSCSDRILVRYKEARRIEEVLHSLRSETANARDLDALLDELTLLSQRVVAYFDFLNQRSSTPADENNTDDNERDRTDAEQKEMISTKINERLQGCGLAKFQRELAGYYNLIESYFMRENASLAIKIDESNGDDADTSTAVDDFFFVMQKCFQRAFAFGDTDAVVLKVILQQVSQCLMNDLLAYMRRRLRETEAALEKVLGGSASMASLPAAALTVSYLTELANKANISIPGGAEDGNQESDVAKYDFFVALNNASVSADYATRLRSNVEKAIQASPKLSTDDRSLLAAPIAQITDAARALLLASEHGVSRLSSVLLARVTPTIETSLKSASYVVSETEYSLDSDATPSFSREVANDIETKVLSSSLEKRLTEKNWDALVRQVAEWYASKIEAIVFLPPTSGTAAAKPFNTFGGLRADRDVRAISAYFSEKSRRGTVRDVFGRLSQLAMVVNLERPAEIYDIWGPNAGGMTWRLAPGEVRRTLSLRTDFNQDAVRALKL